MNQTYFLTLIFSIFILSGCSINNSEISSIKKNDCKSNLNKEKSHYYLFTTIKSSNLLDSVIFFKNLINNLYNQTNHISCQSQSFSAKKIIVCNLTYKYNYWKKKCLQLRSNIISKMCARDKKNLEKIENYLKHPNGRDAYLYGIEINSMNKVCLTIREGGGNCPIIHNIYEFRDILKQNYKECILKNNPCAKNGKYNKWKIIVGYKKNNNNSLIIVVNRYTYIPNSNMTNTKLVKGYFLDSEKYMAIKDLNKIYIISLQKNKHFSEILQKKLLPLSKQKLMELVYKAK